MSAVVSEIAALGFEDLSARPRCGCKGPGAEGWLRSQGYSVPAAANSATVDADAVLVARLATSEFLIESLHESAEGAGAVRVRGSRTQLAGRAQPQDVYPVARMDLVVTVRGAALNALLRQVCSVDFAPLLDAAGSPAAEQPIVLTSMIGVGVVAWPQMTAAGPAVTLWCDPSFGHYFLNTLREVAQDIDSGSMGSKR